MYLEHIFGLAFPATAMADDGDSSERRVLQICYDRNTGKPLGYAVVHFDNAAAAQRAIDTVHNLEVEGRNIVVAPYRPKISDSFGPKPMSSRPANFRHIEEYTAVVLNLHVDATWMCASV
jgi:RNA recognition motif-containing protein